MVGSVITLPMCDRPEPRPRCPAMRWMIITSAW